MYTYMRIIYHIHIYQNMSTICTYMRIIYHIHIYENMPHEKLLGITWVTNPATRKDLAARTWGVFWC